MNRRKLTNQLILLLWSSLLLSPLSIAAQNTERDSTQQVYLSFHYKRVVDHVITAYYEDQQFYLPVVGLFKLLGIDYKIDPAKISISGLYLDAKNRYSIHFPESNAYATLAGRKIMLPSHTFLVKNLDYYLTPDIFEKIFGLHFSVNFSDLNVVLKTDQPMPVVTTLKREQQRQSIQKITYGHEGYPLLYNQKRSWLGGGFLDYALSANISSDANAYSYSFNPGAEILGGDVEGLIYGTYSPDFSTFSVRNLHYHLVTDRNNPFITQLSAGQLYSKGLTNNTILGVQISNEPVVPRRLLGNYTVNGTTVPDADVELYSGAALVGFQKADGLGNYRFSVPLTYGSSEFKVKIYGPGGQVIERAKRVDIPYNFIPKGNIDYNITAGRLDNRIFGIRDSSFVVQSSVSAGLTNALSISTGADYYEGSNNKLPLFYGTVSGRFFTNYNVFAKIAPQAFYEITGSATYPSSLNWRLSYTNYTKERGLYNFSGLNQKIRGQFYVPFTIGNTPLSIRLFGTRRISDWQTLTRYRLNIYTQIRRVNLRLAYRTVLTGPALLSPTSNSDVTASASFNIAQSPTLPNFLEDSYIRLSWGYSQYFNRFEKVELNATHRIFNRSYLQLNLGHNFIGDFNMVGLNLTLNFNKTRVTQRMSRIRDHSISTTALRGSIGFDPYRNNVLLTDRHQAGQAGASFRFYVDENNSGNYDQGERLITKNPIRLKRATGTLTRENSNFYLTPLLSYKRYDVNIYKEAIQDPLLVPEFEQFSFIADPNRYKPIDIPFYEAGVISGNVVMIKNDSLRGPLSGLDIIVDEVKGDFHKVLHTFSDGSFYSYQIPPGNYIIRVDSSQLAILNAASRPSYIKLKVAPGDFIEKLNFTLMPVTKAKRSGSTIPNDGVKESTKMKSKKPE